ncbi:MAG: orotidine-5'-phosphate decarboxylase [Thermoanaerobaculia bacterium]
MSDKPLSRVAVALDTADRSELSRWAAYFGPRVGVLKVGLEAFVRWGPEVVDEVRQRAAAVFLDLKLHDIPNTVAGAVAGAERAEVDYLTVHAAGGRPMLAAAVAAAKRVRLLAVTLLTHLDAATLAELDLAGDGRQRVRSWTGLARRAGCGGAVCSPLEVAELRVAAPSSFLLVTPGIRFGGGPEAGGGEDQRRVATPGAALAAGADLLVLGRPLTRAEDPGRALAELEEALRIAAGPVG